jgi:hypothetical protein
MLFDVRLLNKGNEFKYCQCDRLRVAGQFSFSCIVTAPGIFDNKSYIALVPHFGNPVMIIAG